MHILISGGAGFIGSHLTERLLREGHTVTVVDNFDPFYPEQVKRRNLSAASRHSNFNLVEADIRDPETIMKEVSRPDMIIHLAAKAGVRPSLEQPELYRDVNINGTKAMLGLAEKWKVSKFIFASSSSVYGVNPDVPWKETAALQPISPYAETKIAGEQLCREAAEKKLFPVVALRFFTVFGPRQRPDLAIHKFTKAMIEGKSIPFYGDGTTRRDYTYVDDIISGVMGAVNKSMIAGQFEIFNLGNMKAISLSELVKKISQVVGKEPILEMLPEQKGDVPLTNASVEKAQAGLGYSPATGIEEGLKEFLKWYKEN